MRVEVTGNTVKITADYEVENARVQQIGRIFSEGITTGLAAARAQGAAEERERLLRIVREGIEDINRDVGLTAEAERSMASCVGALRWVERQIEGSSADGGSERTGAADAE